MERGVVMNESAKKFDYFISLGFNCETGLMFRRMGYDESSLFRYTLVGFESMVALIENKFEGLFEYENLFPVDKRMIVDQNKAIYFHTKMLSDVSDATNKYFIHSKEERYAIYREEKSKIDYFIQKWMNQIGSDSRILYFLKSEEPLTGTQIDRLREALQNLGHQSDVEIVLLVKKEWNYSCSKQGVYVRELEFFPPIAQADASDIEGWKNIFNEFPLPERE